MGENERTLDLAEPQGDVALVLIGNVLRSIGGLPAKSYRLCQLFLDGLSARGDLTM